MSDFAKNLRKFRKDKGYSQQKLAKILGYGYTAIANYESGRNQPSIPDLKKIASIFNVSMDYLLGVNDIRHPYVIDDDTAEFNEFRRYYALLNEESKDELMGYMRYLVYKESTAPVKKDIYYGEQELKPMPLKVAQKPEEYR